MNIRKAIKDALNTLGVPVSFSVYTGTSTPYITFFLYNEQGEAWGENKELATGYSVQVDIWSKVDNPGLADQAKTTMTTAGFKRITAHDLYESDTKVFHKAMRFSYVDY